MISDPKHVVVEKRRQGKLPAWKLLAMLLLNFSGFLAGAAIAKISTIVMIGVVALLVNLILLIQVTKSQPSSEDTATKAFLLAFRCFNFALVYTVFAMLGHSVRRH
jgi:hypothetical protein